VTGTLARYADTGPDPVTWAIKASRWGDGESLHRIGEWDTATVSAALWAAEIEREGRNRDYLRSRGGR